MVEAPGTLYLIHFATPYKHARHYLGWVRGDLERRLRNHRSVTLQNPPAPGRVLWKRHRAVKLLGAVNDAGIPWAVVSTSPGTIAQERSLHRRRNNSRRCPICIMEKNMVSTELDEAQSELEKVE